MKLFEDHELAVLSERSQQASLQPLSDARAIAESTLPDTVAMFKEKTGSLIGLLGIQLREAYAAGKIYPLQASVKFYTQDAHKLVVNREVLRDFRAAFYAFYEMESAEDEMPVTFTVEADTVPTLKRLRYPTTLTIRVQYGPEALTSWKNRIVTLSS